MVITTLFSTGGSGASAQAYEPAAREVPSAQTQPPLLTENAAGGQVVVQAGPIAVSPDAGYGTVQPAVVREPEPVASLAALVERTPVPDSLSDELNCLAGAVYFEAKGESLAGQLAVARVIVARTRSGRFPSSYCGVVYQPSQFSFVRGGTMPGINRASRAWANAARIARIAHEGSWKSPAEGALYFHASHVTPMNRTMIAQVDHQVFYR